MSPRITLLGAAVLLLPFHRAAAQPQPAADFTPEWNVLYGREEFPGAEGMLSGHLRKLAAAVQSGREQAIASLKTAADVAPFQADARTRLREAVGALPARTPLNAKVTGRLERGDYAVEKLLFESRPRTYVTANVYVPLRAKGPFPAVLANVGHWAAGKAYPDYQRLGMYLARRGFLVLIFDLAGMGERVEHWDPILRRPIVHPGTSEYFVTTEHGLAAGRTILTTGNLVNYLLWDAIRGLDYLESRADVDKGRIAVTGISGGGWLTELLAALDTRVKVAIPVCYGGCIADQLFRGSATTLDADALIAPRPLLMFEATGDSRASVAQKRRRHEIVSRVYALAGAAERTRFLIAEGPHGFTEPMFAIAHAWLARWLPGTAAVDIPEPRTALETEADLAATLTGQVKSSLGGETLFSLNRAQLAGMRDHAPLPAARDQWQAWRDRLRRVVASAIALPAGAAPPDASTLVRAGKGAYTLEKLVYYSEPGIYVPALLFLPKSAAPAPAAVFVNENGKSADDAVERYLRPLAEAGCAVLAIDPRGMGETASERIRDYATLATGDEAGYFYGALSAGRSVLGMRAYDVIRAVDYLRTRKEVDPNAIAAVGHGAGGVLALYAAALDDRISSAVSTGALVSYSAVVQSETYVHPLSLFVQGGLRAFDLPDLAALIAPRPLRLVNLVDAVGRRLDAKSAAGAYNRAAAVYTLLGARDNLAVLHADSPGEILPVLTALTSRKP